MGPWQDLLRPPFGRTGLALVFVVAGAGCSSDDSAPGGSAGQAATTGGVTFGGGTSSGGTTTSGGSPSTGGAGAASGGDKGATGGAATAGGGSGGSVAGAASGSDTGGSQSGGAGTGGASGGGEGGGTNAGSAGTPAAGSAGAQTVMQESRMALPSRWQEHGVAALDGEVYVVGGYTGQQLSAGPRVIAYNPTMDMWRDIPDFPVDFQHGNVAVVGDRLYVLGFYLGGSMSDADFRTYDYSPTADMWTPRSPMPTGSERATSCVAVHEGRIYLFGGARGGSTVEDASFYDPGDGPGSDSWTDLPPLPEPREHCLAASIGGTIYIASGRAGGIGGFEPTTWAFDPVGEGYEMREPIPTPRGGAAGAVLNGKLYVFGGEGNDDDPSGVFPQIEAYNPATDTWEPVGDMLVPRHGYGAALLDNRIYLPGGATTEGGGAVDDHTVFWLE